MKIGILTNTYDPDANGVSVAIKGLEKQLTEMGNQVFVVAPKHEGVIYPDNVLAVNAIKLPKNISSDLKLPLFYTDEATKFFAQNQIEILHTHDTVMGGIEGLVIANKLKIPAIHTFHTFIEYYDYFKLPGYTKMLRQYLQEVCNGYQHIIAPSQKMYDYLLNLGVSIPMTNLINVPDLETLEKHTTPKNTLNIDPNQDFVFLTFCRLATEKGLDTSIKTLAPILHKYPNVKYLICGDGPAKLELQELTNKLQIQNQVIFTGKYDRSELKYYTSLAKIFIFTSTTDNLPTNIFEAMYFGLPVISINDKSVDYILKNGENGFAVESEKLTEKCEEILNLDLQKYSQNAKKSAFEITPLEIANQHLKLYNRVIEIYKQNQTNNNLFQNLLQDFQNKYTKIRKKLIKFKIFDN
jgi:1,2-diacylglycerol 3-alpha-glucosyltransferase